MVLVHYQLLFIALYTVHCKLSIIECTVYTVLCKDTVQYTVRMLRTIKRDYGDNSRESPVSHGFRGGQL